MKCSIKNKDKAIGDLESELKAIKSCMVEYFQNENLSVDLDRARSNQSKDKNFEEKKKQLPEIQYMLKTLKVIRKYEVNCNETFVIFVQIQEKLSNLKKERDEIKADLDKTEFKLKESNGKYYIIIKLLVFTQFICLLVYKDDNKALKEKLDLAEEELRKTKEYLSKEKIKSEIIAELYEPK